MNRGHVNVCMLVWYFFHFVKINEKRLPYSAFLCCSRKKFTYECEGQKWRVFTKLSGPDLSEISSSQSSRGVQLLLHSLERNPCLYEILFLSTEFFLRLTWVPTTQKEKILFYICCSRVLKFFNFSHHCKSFFCL